MKYTHILLLVILFVISACQKEESPINKSLGQGGDIIEDSYTGTINVTPVGEDLSAVFFGGGDSGVYSMAWHNLDANVVIDVYVNMSGGSVRLVLEDAYGNKVYDEAITGDVSGTITSINGLSNTGELGEWKVSAIFNQFEGSGGYEIDAD